MERTIFDESDQFMSDFVRGGAKLQLHHIQDRQEYSMHHGDRRLICTSKMICRGAFFEPINSIWSDATPHLNLSLRSVMMKITDSIRQNEGESEHDNKNMRHAQSYITGD